MSIPTPRNGTTLVLRRTFAASPQRVFRAWTEVEALEAWLRPGGKAIRVSLLELRVGGSFRFDIEGGGLIVGTYLHIVVPRQLVFTWSGTIAKGQQTIVTLDFLEGGSATEVVLTHEGLVKPDLLSLFGSGWPSLLERLVLVLSLP